MRDALPKKMTPAEWRRYKSGDPNWRVPPVPFQRDIAAEIAGVPDPKKRLTVRQQLQRAMAQEQCASARQIQNAIERTGPQVYDDAKMTVTIVREPWSALSNVERRPPPRPPREVPLRFTPKARP